MAATMFVDFIVFGHVLHCFCKDDKTSFEVIGMKSFTRILAFIICPGIVTAAELHPIVEVQISATNYSSKDDSVPMRSPAGSYSCVLLRRVVAGKVETQMFEGEFHPKAYVSKDDSFDAPSAYKVVAVLDLDGDGKMEIVV